MTAWILVPLDLALTLAVGYLLVLALASRLFALKTPARQEPGSRFALVIPAHDEEQGLGATLANLQALDYPQDLFEIVVVADNCSDRTAEVARAAGARCLERTDSARLGKGYALRFAFDLLLPEGFDALVVVDADTTAAPNMLRAMNTRLAAGQGVIQVRYGVANPDETPFSYAMAVGNAIENDLLLAGRESLGLPTLLRGNGMCFAADVLKRHSWNAHSVVEDTEYSLELLLKGIEARYAGESEVLAAAPITYGQAQSQRIRWASGNSRLNRTTALRLMLKGRRDRRFALVDMGWCLLVRSKALLVLLAGITCALSALSGENLGWTLGLLAAFAGYLALGIVDLGITPQRLRYAVIAPLAILWLVAISLLGLIGIRQDQWTRTTRV